MPDKLVAILFYLTKIAMHTVFLQEQFYCNTRLIFAKILEEIETMPASAVK